MFPWDWTQRVLICDRVIFVEWRRRPPLSWYSSLAMTSFELDDFASSPLSVTQALQLNDHLETAIHQLDPHNQLCVSILSSNDPQHRTKAICLLGIFAVLHGHTTMDAWAVFSHLHIQPFFTPDLSAISIVDCFSGLDKARTLGFLTHEHEMHLTWLTKKLLMIPSPSSSIPTLESFLPYFHSHNVTLVIVLHGQCYDTSSLSHGMEYMELTSDDYPTDTTLSRILEAIDSTPGNVAVHGVEHAGVYLGGYLMRAYGFSAQEATGWLYLSGVVGKIFPQMLTRWERGWSNETVRAEAESASLKINIGGLSFGTSLLGPKEKSKKKLIKSSSRGEGEPMTSRPLLSRERIQA